MVNWIWRIQCIKPVSTGVAQPSPFARRLLMIITLCYSDNDLLCLTKHRKAQSTIELQQQHCLFEINVH